MVFLFTTQCIFQLLTLAIAFRLVIYCKINHRDVKKMRALNHVLRLRLEKLTERCADLERNKAA